MRRTHKADVARRTHVVEPREATWTTWTHTFCVDLVGLRVCVGPWVWWAHKRHMGGVLGPFGQRKRFYVFPVLYLLILLLFLLCGTKFHLNRDLQATWRSVVCWNKACGRSHVDLVDLSPPDHNQST